MKITLIRGVPGSGKTTLAKTLSTHHFEADMFFDMNGGYNPQKIKAAHLWCQGKAFAALAEGHHVVVSNTFTRRWEMEPYIKAAKTVGAEVEEIICTGTWPNVHGVPPEKVEQMRERFEP